MSNDLLQYAQELTSNRITAVTRSSYSNKQAKIIKWFTENYVEYVDTTSQQLVLRLLLLYLLHLWLRIRLAKMEARRRIHLHT